MGCSRRRGSRRRRRRPQIKRLRGAAILMLGLRCSARAADGGEEGAARGGEQVQGRDILHAEVSIVSSYPQSQAAYPP